MLMDQSIENQSIQDDDKDKITIENNVDTGDHVLYLCGVLDRNPKETSAQTLSVVRKLLDLNFAKKCIASRLGIKSANRVGFYSDSTSINSRRRIKLKFQTASSMNEFIELVRMNFKRDHALFYYPEDSQTILCDSRLLQLSMSGNDDYIIKMIESQPSQRRDNRVDIRDLTKAEIVVGLLNFFMAALLVHFIYYYTIRTPKASFYHLDDLKSFIANNQIHSACPLEQFKRIHCKLMNTMTGDEYPIMDDWIEVDLNGEIALINLAMISLGEQIMYVGRNFETSRFVYQNSILDLFMIDSTELIVRGRASVWNNNYTQYDDIFVANRHFKTASRTFQTADFIEYERLDDSLRHLITYEKDTWSIVYTQTYLPFWYLRNFWHYHYRFDFSMLIKCFKKIIPFPRRLIEIFIRSAQNDCCNTPIFQNLNV